MKKVFICSSGFVFASAAAFLVLTACLFSSCVSLAQDKFIDEAYPSETVLSAETEILSGKIFYEDSDNKSETESKSKNSAETSGKEIGGNDLKIRIKKGMKYPVSNPLLALSGAKSENGSMNVFFTPFSGDDGNMMKNKYKAFLTVGGVEKKLSQSVLVYKDNRGRQYVKKTFKSGGVSYKFQNSFSDFYVKYPYMFCEIQDGKKIYKVFAVGENWQSGSDSESGEKRFITQGIRNESQKYVVVSGNSIAADFTKSEYNLYPADSESAAVLKESIAVVLSVFRFIEENEK